MGHLDVWWVSYGLSYERSEKHISFAFTLKAGHSTGQREGGDVSCSLLSPDRDHSVASSSNIQLKTLSLSLCPWLCIAAGI